MRVSRYFLIWLAAPTALSCPLFKQRRPFIEKAYLLANQSSKTPARHLKCYRGKKEKKKKKDRFSGTIQAVAYSDPKLTRRNMCL